VEAAWRETGILPQQINTVYQLYADLRQEPDLIDRVDRFLPLPDLVAHLLGAPAQAGRAIASTTGLASPGAREGSAPRAPAPPRQHRHRRTRTPWNRYRKHR